MPRPPVTKPKILANKIFVNRDEPLDIFKKTASSIPYDNVELLVYYGLGGMGKTELRKQFEAALKDDKTFSNIHSAVLDLHKRINLDPALTLVYIRNELAKSKTMSFPAFDLAFALYWQEAYPERPLPELHRGWTAGGNDFAADIITEASKIGIEGMASFATEGIPFVGNALRRVITRGIKVGKQKYTMATNDALKSIFCEGKLLGSAEIEDNLPLLLASDLEQQLLKNKEYRFVIFIDEYEKVFNEGGFAAGRRDNSFDKAVRNLITELKGTLVVIMSRERLPWDEFKPEWKDWLKEAHHRLQGLAFRDAEKFLLAVPVSEEDIRLAIIAGSKADLSTGNEQPIYPLLLDLQVDHYFRLKEQNSNLVRPEEFSIKANSFKDLLNKIMLRFLRDYPFYMENTLKRLSIARYFDRSLFVQLVKDFTTGFPLDRFEELTNMSFVDETKEEKIFKIHNSIRSELQEFISSEDVMETHEAIVKFYTPIAIPIDHKSITDKNIDALNELVYSKCCLAPNNLLAWWNDVSSIYKTAAFNKQLEPSLHLIFNTIEKTLGPDHPDTATSLNNLASNLHLQGRYEQAQPLMERALKIREEVLGPKQPETARSLNNLASNLYLQGRYEQAQPLFERALKIREEVLGTKHPDTATSLNGLALNLGSQGWYEQAQPLYERALKISEEVQGPKHPDTATSLNNLACNLDSQGRNEQAQPLYERALEISEEVLGPKHPDTATSLNGLAINLYLQGRYEQAHPLYERALKIYEEVQGPKHPITGTILNNLASNYYSQRRYEQAQPLYERALIISEEALGPKHPETATSLNNLASNLDLQGRYEQAQPLYERALKIREEVLGPKHPDTATSLNGLALNLYLQGQYEQAQPLYERALKIREEVLGSKHPDTATSLNNLALNLDFQGRYEQAQPLYERALKIREEVLGPNHPDTAASLTNLVSNLKSQGRYEQAQPLYERALKIREEVLGPKNNVKYL